MTSSHKKKLKKKKLQKYAHNDAKEAARVWFQCSELIKVNNKRNEK